MQREALERALITPEQIFNTPGDVTADQSLDQQTKIDILAAWMANEKAHVRAPARCMPSQHRHMGQVVRELKKLQM